MPTNVLIADLRIRLISRQGGHTGLGALVEVAHRATALLQAGLQLAKTRRDLAVSHPTSRYAQLPHPVLVGIEAIGRTIWRSRLFG
jgi:hypothetical protein